MTTIFVDDYLHQLHTAQHEDAYMRLVEADAAVVPQLIQAFHTTTSPAVRVTLIEIIGQHRQSSTVDFLTRALRTDDPQQWQAALDGLVMLNSAASIQVLEAERKQLIAARQPSSTRLAWFDEALEQLTESGAEPQE